MSKLEDILSGDEDELSEEDFLSYLDENTSEQEKQAIEQKMSGSSFETDAVEGLQKLNDPVMVRRHVDQMNQKLRQELLNKKKRKGKQTIQDIRWIILAIVLLLFVCVIGYVVIKMQR